MCIYSAAFHLARPIAAPGRDGIDPSYRFGSTQGGQRDPHHGVEFLDPSGTPVLAAEDGMVVVAGDDLQTLYGAYYNFYGNLVVLEHELPGVAQPVYTLYAHLSGLLVRKGQRVERGQEIGWVGMTGSATGAHLHFEVRLGENTYAAARNPELWLEPLPDQSGQQGGAIAGRLLAPQGVVLNISSVVLEQLPTPQQAPISQVYLGVYEEKSLPGQPPWGESFAAGDLPAGWYRISFIQYGLQERLVQVFPGQLTLVTFNLGQVSP